MCRFSFSHVSQSFQTAGPRGFPTLCPPLSRTAAVRVAAAAAGFCNPATSAAPGETRKSYIINRKCLCGRLDSQTTDSLWPSSPDGNLRMDLFSVKPLGKTFSVHSLFCQNFFISSRNPPMPGLSSTASKNRTIKDFFFGWLSSWYVHAIVSSANFLITSTAAGMPE
jgi:hypothetical protein